MEEKKEVKNPEKGVEERKEKIKILLKDKYNLAIISILIFAFIILLYYFNLTKNQPLWWDEAEYMSTAKHWAFGIDYPINPQRPPLFPFLEFLLFKIGLGELLIKFILVIVPAWLSVFFIYLLVKELYDNKKLALITAFILSVSWINLFYAERIMTDSSGFLFGILAFFCFWKGYINNKGKIYIWIVGFFIALSFLLRLTGILYGIVIFLFLLITDRFRFIKNKHIWISLLIAFLTVSPFLIWSYYYFHNPFAFRAGYEAIPTTPLGWWMVRFVYDYPELVFFIFFLVGLVTLIPMILSLDLIFLKNEKKLYNDFFAILIILFTLGFFIYFLRNAENRWLILMSIGIFIFSAKGILLVFEFAKKKLGKVLAIAVIVLILIAGAYYQLKHADAIIKMKKDTYSQVRDAALWMKENSNKEDIIATASLTQTVYYAERKVINFWNYSSLKYYTSDEFDGVIESNRPKYLIISSFEPGTVYNAQWTFSYPQKNPDAYKPVRVWFEDSEQKNPLLIIYEINYTNLFKQNRTINRK